MRTASKPAFGALFFKLLSGWILNVEADKVRVQEYMFFQEQEFWQEWDWI